MKYSDLLYLQRYGLRQAAEDQISPWQLAAHARHRGDVEDVRETVIGVLRALLGAALIHVEDVCLAAYPGFDTDWPVALSRLDADWQASGRDPSLGDPWLSFVATPEGQRLVEEHDRGLH